MGGHQEFNPKKSQKIQKFLKDFLKIYKLKKLGNYENIQSESVSSHINDINFFYIVLAVMNS